MKFLMFFSWLTSIFSLWIIVRLDHQQTILSFSKELFIKSGFHTANNTQPDFLEQELIGLEEKTNREARNIFSKIEKIKAAQNQNIINIIDQSEHLTNIEKAEMYPDIHQFITSNKFNHWIIKE